MKTAFVYYLEFTNDDNIYIKLLTKSIESLITYQYCKGSDIFVNVIGYSGTPIWKDDHYETIIESPNNTWQQLRDLVSKYNINLIDVSEGHLHYVELPVLVDISLPVINDLTVYESKDTTRLKFYNHKFTSYPEIIKSGYDKIVQLDADLIFYKSNANIFNVPDLENPDIIYYCRFNNTIFNREIITDIINSRESNNIRLFSLKDTPETKIKYELAKKFISGTLNYDIDNFINDIYNLKFWVSGGTGVISKAFIEKHFQKLSFLNYFFTKDDEIALMLHCFANNIKIKNLDPLNLIVHNRNIFNITKHIAYHPCGYTDKIDLITNNFIINNII